MLRRNFHFGQDRVQQVCRVLVWTHHENAQIHDVSILGAPGGNDKLPVSRGNFSHLDILTTRSKLTLCAAPACTSISIPGTHYDAY